MSRTITERNLRMIVRAGVMKQRMTEARDSSLQQTFYKKDLETDQETLDKYNALVAREQGLSPADVAKLSPADYLKRGFMKISAFRGEVEKALEKLRFAEFLPEDGKDPVFVDGFNRYKKEILKRPGGWDKPDKWKQTAKNSLEAISTTDEDLKLIIDDYRELLVSANNKPDESGEMLSQEDITYIIAHPDARVAIRSLPGFRSYLLHHKDGFNVIRKLDHFRNFMDKVWANEMRKSIEAGTFLQNPPMVRSMKGAALRDVYGNLQTDREPAWPVGGNSAVRYPLKVRAREKLAKAARTAAWAKQKGQK